MNREAWLPLKQKVLYAITVICCINQCNAMVQTIRMPSVRHRCIYARFRVSASVRGPQVPVSKGQAPYVSMTSIRSGKFALEPPTSGPKTTAHSTEGMQLALRLALPGAMWVF